MPRRLRDVGEHGWIAGLIRRLGDGGRGVVLGAGDDAAVVRPTRRSLVLTTDALVEGVHFRLGWEPPAALGRRLFRVNASDVAAMGAVPRWALLAVEASPALPVATLDAVVRGFAGDARAAGAALVGGNLARATRLAFTVTLIGEARDRVVRRAGARPGDLLYVTGTLGGAGWAVRERLAGRRVRRPPVPRRWAAAAQLGPLAHAMLDVSDGLLQDLGHLCRASGVAAELDLPAVPVAPSCRSALGAAAPRFAIAAGEDYELLLAVPPSRARALARLALGCRLTRIGRLVRGGAAVRVLDATGRRVVIDRGGFDHFGGRGK